MRSSPLVTRLAANPEQTLSTKQVARFHPPYVAESVKELAQHQDLLHIHAKEAWDIFLELVTTVKIMVGEFLVFAVSSVLIMEGTRKL